MDTIRQTIYLDKDTKEKLRFKAYQDNKSQNKIVIEALMQALDTKNS